MKRLFIFNHHMDDAAPPANQVFNCGSDGSVQKDDPHFSLGLDTYPGRVLGATSEDDIIQLPQGLGNELPWVVEHYARIGLRHTHNVIWDGSFEVVRKYPHHQLSTFYFGERAHAVQPDEAWYNITKMMNSKNNFIRLCEKLELPVPVTHCFDTKAMLMGRGLFEDFQYPLYLKADTSVSGRGVIRCESCKQLIFSLSWIEDSVPVQLQEEISAQAFINVQYTAHNGVLERSLVTAQLLDGFSHSGNVYPTPYDPWGITDPLAQYMFERGMRGVFAFDVVVDHKGRMYLLECNPRYNGASYPSAIAQKLGITHWRAKTFTTRLRTLQGFDLGEQEYSHTTRQGVVVVNWGPVLQGKLGLLLAGNPQTQELIEKKLLKVL